MVFFILCLSIFIMFFQPASVFPEIAKYQLSKYIELSALIIFIFVGQKSRVSFLSVKVNRYFLAFVILQIISSFIFWVQSGFEMLNIWIEIGIMYYLIVKSVNSGKKAKSIMFVLIISIGYLCYFSIINFVLQYLPGMRAGGFGWYTNANDLCLILIVAIPMALYFVNASNSFLLKLIFVIVFFAFSFNILFTGSRNGLLGVLTVVTLSMLISIKLPKFLRGTIVISLFLLVITVGITNVLNRSGLETGLTGDDSSENRKIQWKAGMGVIADYPLFGVGKGQFVDMAESYGGIRKLMPHNTILQAFIDTGIPSGIFFCLFAFYPLFDGLKFLKKIDRRKINTDSITIYRFLLIALAGFWVCAFFGNRYHEYALYLVIALIIAVRENIIKKEILPE